MKGYSDKISFDEFIDILTGGKGERIKKELGEIEEVEDKDKGGKIFVIGDLHLDHTNIIKYCNRPFSSTKEMNEAIVNNWNEMVKQKDIVYFLGDMAFGKGSRKMDYWLNKLNGEVIFIKGNHDKSKEIKLFNDLILKYEGYKFLLIHNPQNVSEQWKGWVIHGHGHNNDLKNYPFINGKKKTINVGVEVIDYKPLDIKKLFKLNFTKIRMMKTINSEPLWME